MKEIKKEEVAETRFLKWWTNWKIVTLILSFVCVGAGSGIAGGAPLSLFQKAMGYPIMTAAVTMTFFGIPRGIMNIFGGWIADRMGAKFTLLLGLPLWTIVPYICYAIATDWTLIAVGQFFSGFAVSIAATAMATILSDYTTKEIRGSVLGARQATISYAGIPTKILGAYLVGLWGGLTVLSAFRYCYWLSTIGGTLGIICVLVVPQPRKAGYIVSGEAASSGKSEVTSTKVLPITAGWGEAWKVIKSPSMIGISYAAITFKFIESYTTVVMPWLIVTTGIGGAVEVALLGSVYSFFHATGNFIGGMYSDKIGRRKTIILGWTIATLGYALYSQFLSLWPMMILMAIGAFGSGSTYGISEAYSSEMAPSRLLRSRVIGYWRFWRDFGSLAGPIILAYLYEAFGNLSSGYLLLAMSASNIIVTYLLCREEARVL